MIREELLEHLYDNPPRIDLKEENEQAIWRKTHKMIRDHVANDLPDSADTIAKTGVDAARRVKGMGLSPVHLIRYLSGSTGKAK